VAGLQQPAGGGPPRLDLVGDDRRKPAVGGQAAQQDHPDTGQRARHPHLSRGLGGVHDAVHLPAEQVVDQLRLDGMVALGLRDDEQVLVLHGGREAAPDQIAGVVSAKSM
jgi:hypothetical protein